MASPFFAPLPVARIFSFAMVAQADLQRETQAPDGHERQDEDSTVRNGIHREPSHEGENNKPGAPCDIRHVVPSQSQGDQEPKARIEGGCHDLKNYQIKHGSFQPPGIACPRYS